MGYASLGIEWVVAVLMAALGGHYLDDWLGTSPWLLILGFVFGAAAGFLNIIRLVTLEEIKKRKKEG